jgi:glycolate dehydrogenase iron-sulfur subunit
VSTLTSSLVREEEKLLACIHCGLCLEACPTYVITGDENDGPRGRLYLMRAVGEGRLPSTSAAFERHIDRCLGCRACEQVCPAGVEYGQLLEAARGEIFQNSTKRGFSYSLLGVALKHVWLHPARLRFAFALARLIRDSGVAGIMRGIASLFSQRLAFAFALLESSKRKVGEKRAMTLRAAPATGATMLFTGCVGAGLFSRVNDATIRVLNVNGLAVQIPERQVCCGALHAHAGDLEGARRLARQNIAAFESECDGAFVITNAGGCGAMLKSYAHLLADDAESSARANKFSKRVRDVSQQLQSAPLKEAANANAEAVTYDASCHLLYGQGAGESSVRMVDAACSNFKPLAGSERCCGGAGIYNLMEPDLSGKVLAEKLANIRATGARVLATGNPGCQMQIGAGAKLSGMDLIVCHPVELLDESYARTGFYEKGNASN